MKFKVGDSVRIRVDYLEHRELQGQTGIVTSSNNDLYTVKLDGGITHNRQLEGKLTQVSGQWLEPAFKMPLLP